MTVIERQQSEMRRLVEIGREQGWITLKPNPPARRKRTSREKYLADLERFRERRHRFMARGLTCLGTRRINKRRPRLKGLNSREYHRRYMQLWRRAKQCH